MFGFSKYETIKYNIKKEPKEHCKTVTLECEHSGVKIELDLKVKSTDLFLLNTISEIICFSFEMAKAERKVSE